MQMPEVKSLTCCNMSAPVLDYAALSRISISPLLESWNRQRKIRILRIMCLNHVCGAEDSRNYPEGQLGRLFVSFSCAQCDTLLFGWDDIRTHRCTYLYSRLGYVPDTELPPFAPIAFHLWPIHVLQNVPQWAVIVTGRRVMVKEMDSKAPHCVFRSSKQGENDRLFIFSWRQYVGGLLGIMASWTHHFYYRFPMQNIMVTNILNSTPAFL